jgi:predicted phosphodiesterase
LFFRVPETKVIPVGGFYGALWVFISFLFLVTVLPVCLTFWFTKIWDRIGIKCKPIEEVIKKRYNAKKGGKIDADIIVFGHTHNAGYYPKELKKDERLFINTNITVFGHTHNAGYYPKELKNEERLFINTGCWVDISEKKMYREGRLYLLKWNEEVKEEEKNITCVKDFREVLSQ